MSSEVEFHFLIFLKDELKFLEEINNIFTWKELSKLKMNFNQKNRGWIYETSTKEGIGI